MSSRILRISIGLGNGILRRSSGQSATAWTRSGLHPATTRARVHRLLTLPLALALLAPGPLAAQTRETGDPPLSVTNRERSLRFTLLFDGESIAYRVDRLTPDGAANTVIERSPLGITRAGQDFRRGLELIGASPVTEQSGVYRMLTGKQLEARARSRQRVFTFRKGTSGLLTVTVRA